MTDLLAEEMRLRDSRRPYAVATVVRVRQPASSRPGDRALVTEDGSLLGWVGGSCTSPVVVREALAALSDGRVRLLRLGPPDRLVATGPADLAADGRPGVVSVPLTCASEGEIEVLVQPVPPPPDVVAVGNAPVLDLLVDMARRIGYAADRVEPPGTGLDAVRGELAPRLSSGTYVIVATFGRFDEDAVQTALEAGADYVALVASTKRAATLLQTLRDAGVREADLARVRAPAGLDLGSLEHQEMTVALLADIVAEQARRRATLAVPPAPPVAAQRESLDPVCGMSVGPDAAGGSVAYAGVTYRFCGGGCRRAFEADPARFSGTGHDPGRRRD